MALKDWIDSIGYYNEAPNSKTRVLLFGDTGVGKTRLAGTFPAPFFIDSDKGGKTLESLHIPYLNIERDGKVFELILDVLRSLRKKEDLPFVVQTLVFDSLTSLADALMVEAMRTGKVAADVNRVKPEWDHYSIVQSRMKTFMKYCQDMQYNIVATCGTKLEKDDVRGTFVGKPNILGGYRDLVGFDFDDVIYMACEGTQTARKYKAYTTRVSYYDAKSRSGLAPVYEDPTYEKLYGKKEATV